MASWFMSTFRCLIFCLLVFVPETCLAGVRLIGRVNPGFRATQMSTIANDGLFLVSNSSNFAFGFANQKDDPTLFQLVVVHMGRNAQTVVWSANRATLVGNSDEFIFDDNGIARLQMGDATVWSTDTSGKGVVAMELWDSGNLVLLGTHSVVVWQSFNNPTNTLLQNQNFSQGMRLVSNPSSTNLTYHLELKSGDMMLSAAFETPQPYWLLSRDSRKTVNSAAGEEVDLASIDGGSWNFYNRNKGDLIWQFPILNNGGDPNPNGTWIAVLGDDGSISFSNLLAGASTTKIPSDSCDLPEYCDAYVICSDGNMCSCPQSLNQWNCDGPAMNPPCAESGPDNNVNLVEVKDATDYFAIEFVSPVSETSLDGCKSSCLTNCSCVALFFQNSSGNCFQFDRVGNFRRISGNTVGAGYLSFVKVRDAGDGNGNGNGKGNGAKHFPYAVIIVIATVFVILGLVYIGYRRFWKKTDFPESPAVSEEDNFLGNLSGMPVRFSYAELQTATENFSIKLGQGGFGSVYKGVLPDGTRVAVKKLEGLGQGKKEFRAEVSIIGSIHHLHLVKLKGFCAEGSHRLLAYEFMANGSLDKWIFKKKKGEEDGLILDWDTRFSIALRTAKGLAYLHDDCDVKIVHCDIKPENVLLDENYNAKVSDFGLAKLMSREQSHVFTTLRGTRGYLAPEWITNYAISEKSDVYSYGMVLLEIIGGRKNYDPEQTSEKSYFPSYAFKMAEEGRIKDVLDKNMTLKDSDERTVVAIKVALWCIQDDMCLRPSMTRVVQMLEGICPVPDPPVASPMRSRLFSGMFKSSSGEGTSSGTSVPSEQYNSEAYLSAVRLSGPR